MSNDDLNFSAATPRHIAIIMDGNGRWAQKRFMPRAFGHQAGVKTVRKMVEYCARNKIEVLSLFAFSSENWRRPQDEVSMLMNLFLATLQSEINKLDRNNIRLRFIGDRSQFSDSLQKKMAEGETQTQNNTALTLVIAANYGGRWDMCQACQQVLDKMAAGELPPQAITEQLLNQHLSTAGLPEPDLFIRTGGEQRVSNFMLWQLAYTEMYFTPTLWPDFDEAALEAAVVSFTGRQRRFGHTGEQIANRSVTL
ncbi:polyprenyl diphosphate synthase [Methylovulum psychrotolerans]|jgi:undecaprenyl diphosphate synthase|uniref:Ditrans,polycis-undecaprenyl-diphosphate synthase ((2E,6E)-farnesyl-diphosphate specific) n=1 Tax=Methylovulum psychrotolerans TaxID=1704499 RepID=A0A1Z4C320_9GAMM|nr:polyprenyl diphosphate synthase [Methylovulum psychrotolerans]ASF47890.1 di-trans,poly-cis-decaprenylcistransferase [Methylovulum psychrotolerans]MBT9099873.1 di-trans,poly-cis-decaprenylcistransferase [Methylovulum psychrotolerans]POZ53146.1 di-trans,poly-cis-decaprenylcistransferase [Methylovulum psychrotolerans]